MTLIPDVTEDNPEQPENDSKAKKAVKPYIASDQTAEAGTIRKDKDGRVWLKVRDD